MKRYFSTFIVFCTIVCLGKHALAQVTCQTITANIVSTSPPAEASDNSLIRICQGESVTFTGTATFEVTGAGATYQWRISDGVNNTLLDGQTVTQAFPTQGIYVVDLIVTDSSGCTNNQCDTDTRARMVVQVSTTPHFTGTSGPDTICLHQSAVLQGVVIPVPADYNCAPPVSDTTYLPDGTGVSYTTTINVTCFTPCDTIVDSSQIESVCMNIEHSFIGDLDAKIICPNAQWTNLFNTYQGADYGTFLGNPIDVWLDPIDSEYCEGFSYCFTNDATWENMVEEVIANNTEPVSCTASNGTTVTSGNSMLPGDYQPEGSYNSLIGCPLNGDWTIQITDHQAVDDGHIFFWDINFNVPTPNYSFTPEYPEQSWSGPGIISQNGNDITVQPDAAGTYCYTFTVTDNFDCTYDTTICLTVIDPGNPGADSTASICLNHEPVNLIDYLAGNPEAGGVWSGNGVNPNGVFNPAAMTPGTYTYTYTRHNWQCDTSAHVYLTVNNNINVDFNYTLIKGCDGDSVAFTNLSDSGRYWWNYGDNTAIDSTKTNPVHFYQDQNQYNVKLIAQDTLGCIDSISKVVDTRHPLEAVFGQSADSVCQTGAAAVLFTNQSIGDIDEWHWDFGDSATSDLESPNHIYTVAGTYTIRLIVKETGLPCTDTAYSTIYVDSTQEVKLLSDRDSICNGEKINFSLDYLHSATNFHWNFGDNSGIDGYAYSSTAHGYDNPGTYQVTITMDYPVCPAVTDNDTITVKPYPVINLPADTSLCLNGAPFIIVNNEGVDPAIHWRWSTGDTTAALKVVHPGTYTVLADLDGCITNDELTVRKDCYVDVPNAFTPNGDGANDYFFPRQYLTEGLTDFKMTIFNRWGQKVFETTQPDGRGWDGKFNDKEQPSGVYVYIIDIQFKNKAAEHYEGNVTLLR